MPFQKDIETLELYLEMEAFRCNNKFRYRIEVAHELLHGDYKVPPMLIQPFIENAIHHGLLNKMTNDRVLNIKMTTNNNFIHYSIADNGIGRTQAEELRKLNNPEHISYGIAITKERIALYNNSAVNGFVISDIMNNDVICGTKVEIDLKFY